MNKKTAIGITVIVLLIISGVVLVVRNNKEANDTSNQRVATVAGGSIPIESEAVKVAKLKYEKASVNLVKAVLNVYYLTNSNSYPVTFEQLQAQVEANPYGHYDNTSPESITKALNGLPNFKYSDRGDLQAYEFTYTSVTGEVLTENGNYRLDYH